MLYKKKLIKYIQQNGRDLWRKTPVNKRPTLVENVRKRREEWEPTKKRRRIKFTKTEGRIRSY